jgi:hypothetical protein
MNVTDIPIVALLLRLHPHALDNNPPLPIPPIPVPPVPIPPDPPVPINTNALDNFLMSQLPDVAPDENDAN